MTSQSGLDYLRSRTIVDCDTLDDEVVKTLGPFQDSISNQAIVFNELSKPGRADVTASSVADAKALHSTYSSITVEELAVEIATVRLAIAMAEHIKGRLHVHTNPYYCYSTEKTVINALRIVRLFQHVKPGFEVDRIAINIPTTWEGMLACHTLELAGVRTSATALFSMAQAVLAAEVGCTYVAPCVNDLKAQSGRSTVDEHKLLPLCVAIQQYYKSINAGAQVLPTNFKSTEEIFQLAGVDHMAIQANLLEQLCRKFSTTPKSLFDDIVPTAPVMGPGASFLHDPGKYQITFARESNGVSQMKVTEAVNIFCDFQDKLEKVMKASM